MASDLECTLCALLCFALLPVSLLGQDVLLDQLPSLRQYEAQRITCADPTGGNNWRYLGPAATLALAEVKGPDCIVLRDEF